MLLPAILIVLGGIALIALAFAKDNRALPVHEPDLPPGAPGQTRYMKINAIMPQLQQAAQTSGVPLGLLIGWVAKESGGRLDEVTKMDERGLFQLHPAESKALGIDHQRLSTDLVYSINAGLMLIAKYMKLVDGLAVAPRGSQYYWWLVKFNHSIGSGATKKIVEAAKAAGKARTLDALRTYAMDHESELFRAVKHSPTKWAGLTDAVMVVGQPFGFGDAGTVLVGALFDDLVDPLDCLS